MPSYALGPIVGRIGGTKADRIEVDMPGLAGSGVHHVIAQIDAPPDGLTRIVHIDGEFLTSASLGHLRPQLVLGDFVSDGWPVGPAVFTALIAEPGQVAVFTRLGSGVHFRGIVYVADIDLNG